MHIVYYGDIEKLSLLGIVVYVFLLRKGRADGRGAGARG